LWNSADSREAILLELKTKKYDKGINMADVGQGFNHYQASRTALNGSSCWALFLFAPIRLAVGRRLHRPRCGSAI
jgi:hypothetical protein